MPSTAPIKRSYGPAPSASGKPGVLDDYLAEEAAAAELGIKLKTLEKYRRLRIGPKFTIVARRVLYSRDNLKAWLVDGGSKDVR